MIRGEFVNKVVFIAVHINAHPAPTQHFVHTHLPPLSIWPQHKTSIVSLRLMRRQNSPRILTKPDLSCDARRPEIHRPETLNVHNNKSTE